MDDETAIPNQDSPFWRFSLRFYALPGVAPACLTLQDEAGVDVNVLLFLLFLAGERREVSAEGVRRLDAAIHRWREEVVKPLRELRRELKGGIAGIESGSSDFFRNRIKRAELEAERIEQETLERCAGSFAANPARTAVEIAGRNLSAYRETIGGWPDRASTAILEAFESLSF